MLTHSDRYVIEELSQLYDENLGAPHRTHVPLPPIATHARTHARTLPTYRRARTHALALTPTSTSTALPSPLNTADFVDIFAFYCHKPPKGKKYNSVMEMEMTLLDFANFTSATKLTSQKVSLRMRNLGFL